MPNILFICSNNISRSPAACAVFLAKVREAGLQRRFTAESAGSYPGLKSRSVDRRLLEAAGPRGYDLSAHRTRELVKLDLAHFDHLSLMDEDSHWFIKSIHPQIDINKLSLYLHHSGQLGIREVPDPVVGESSFDEMLTILEKGAPGLIRYLCVTLNVSG